MTSFRSPDASRFCIVSAILLATGLFGTAIGYADDDEKSGLPDPLREATIDQSNLGEQIPLDLTFYKTTGEAVRLSEFFGEKPVILNLVYFECPMLCSVAMDELTKTLRVMDLTVGEEFTVLTVSFDPFETPTHAIRRRNTLLKRYGREPAKEGWHFLTAKGDREVVESLTDAVGFDVVFDKQTGRYSHPSGIIILTPEGKISRYLHGLEHTAKDVEFAVMESSQEKIGSPTKQLLLLCYIYDPTIGKYGLAIHRGMQIFGTLTAIGLIGAIIYFLRRERRSKRLSPEPTS